MKKLCLLYGNCQMDGVAHFLRKTRMADDFDFVIVHNWQLMMGEQLPKVLYESLPKAHVVVYQPCRGYDCRDKSQVPGTHELLNRAPRAKGISFAYQFNHGFFPLVKLSDGRNGWITSDQVKRRVDGIDRRDPIGFSRARVIVDYQSGNLAFDCCRRFIECIAEQGRREKETDVRMVPWIVQEYRRQRLFLTHNHPTSALFAELATQIHFHVYGGVETAMSARVGEMRIANCDENEAKMNGVMPLHPAVVNEMGLEYFPTDGATEYYRTQLEQMIKESMAW